jgi:hypothetical protein
MAMAIDLATSGVSVRICQKPALPRIRRVMKQLALWESLIAWGPSMESKSISSHIAELSGEPLADALPGFDGAIDGLVEAGGLWAFTIRRQPARASDGDAVLLALGAVLEVLEVQVSPSVDFLPSLGCEGFNLVL